MAMKVDTVIAGGRVVTGNGVIEGSVGIRDGRIACLAEGAHPGDLTAPEVIDARGRWVLPGLIEPHCHFWDPGPTHREDWSTGTAAAAAGGITTVIEMPLSDPPTVDAAAFTLKLNRAAAQARVDWALWGGIVPESAGDLERRLDDMDALGAVAYKAFMCWSAREFPPVDDGVLATALSKLGQRQGLLAVHAENDAIIRFAEARLRESGRRDPAAYLASRPPQAELEAIERAMMLARVAGAPLYIVHMTLAEGARRIRAAREGGQVVFVETAPQYLALDEEAVLRQGPYAKCAPPLRSRANVEALWTAVLDGTVDTIGSDHAPFTREEKDAGAADIWEAPNGLSGIQTMLPVLLTEGVHRRAMSMERLCELTSTHAARIFGLYPRKGVIWPGSDADLVIVDLDRTWQVSGDLLFTKQAFSPYDGMVMHGGVERTILRGRTVARGGTVLAEPGSGRQVRPLRPRGGPVRRPAFAPS